ERRRGQVRFGGRSKLDLTVRGPGLPGGTGLVQATLAARYDLAPGQTTCTFEYDMQLARGRVGEWVFAADPVLRVTDVVVNNRDGWRAEPGALRSPGSTRPCRRPPRVRAAAAGPVFAAAEAVEWRLDAGRQTVTARVGLRVRRGPLFQFTLLAPPGFAIDRPAAPDDLIGY